ncbi:MAG: hypothetical protein LBS01_06375, partial [Prevotellaceae bacterium]|nr:hypothetical protein [Prevotellaceae bacterium]
MAKYNSDIHHRRSIRLQRYDYSREGLYFITICTQNRECLFGEIVGANGIRPNENAGVCHTGVCHTPLPTGTPTMVLSEIGKIVENEWVKSAKIRAEIEIHAYCVMPNHFHAIAEIVAVDTYNDGTPVPNGTPVGANGIRPNENAGVCNAGVCHTPLPTGTSVRANGIRPNEQLPDNTNAGVCHTPLRAPSKTVGALVRGFKSAVTKQIGFSPWQRNYFEHIIRDWQS